MRVDTLLAELKTAWSNTFTGDTMYDYPPAQINAPAVAVVLENVEYDSAFGGSMDATIRIQVFHAAAAVETPEYASMGELADSDDGGFKQVIEDGTYTQGVSVKVTGLSEIGMTNVAGADYFTFSIMVEAID